MGTHHTNSLSGLPLITYYMNFSIDFIAVPHPSALFTLSGVNGTMDISPHRGTSALSHDIMFAAGPYGNENGSFFFKGNNNSYVELKNTGNLDTRFSIGVFAWVYLDNTSGLIFKYEKNNYYGCSMKVLASNLGVSVRYMNRKGTKRYVLYKKNILRANVWNFVGTSYDYHTRLATVFVNNSTVIKRVISTKMDLATHYDVRIGATRRQTAYFRGRISCLQIYDQALSRDQIMKIKTNCNETGKYQMRPASFSACANYYKMRTMSNEY